MTTLNPTGFCPSCNQKVLLSRKRMNWGLAILLLIFTAGIGLIIYAIMHYSEPENRCVHCGTIVNIVPQSKPVYNTERSTQQVDNGGNPYRLQFNNSVSVSEDTTRITSQTYNFCAFCGEKLNAGTRFCQNCGGKTE